MQFRVTNSAGQPGSEAFRVTLSALTGRVLGKQGHYWSTWDRCSPTMTSEHLSEAGLFPYLEGRKLRLRADKSGRVLGKQGHYWSTWDRCSPTMTSEHLSEAGLFPYLEGRKLRLRADKSFAQGLPGSQQVAERRFEPSYA